MDKDAGIDDSPSPSWLRRLHGGGGRDGAQHYVAVALPQLTSSRFRAELGSAKRSWSAGVLGAEPRIWLGPGHSHQGKNPHSQRNSVVPAIAYI